MVFRTDEFIIYCASKHRLAKRKSIRLDDLVQERWAISAAGAFGPLLSLRDAFKARGLPLPTVTVVSDLVMFKLRVVAASDLVGVTVRQNVNATVGQLRLKILPVKDLVWLRPVAIAYRKDAYLSPAAKRFVEIISAIAKKRC